MNVPERLKSRKLWVTVGYTVTMILNYSLGWGIPVEVGASAGLVVAAYLGGQSAVDFAETKQSIIAGSDVARLQAVNTARVLQAELQAVQQQAMGELEVVDN